MKKGVSQNEKRNYQQKKTKGKTNNMTVKDKRPSIFYFTDFEQVFAG